VEARVTFARVCSAVLLVRRDQTAATPCLASVLARKFKLLLRATFERDQSSVYK
jgi:hypothetical protein